MPGHAGAEGAAHDAMIKVEENDGLTVQPAVDPMKAEREEADATDWSEVDLKPVTDVYRGDDEQ